MTWIDPRCALPLVLLCSLDAPAAQLSLHGFIDAAVKNASAVQRAEAEFALAEAELQLAEARLQLVYAESALRYDLAVHPLEPLRQAVDRSRERALSARAAQLQSKQLWQQALDAWWTSYQGTGAEARRAYWRSELVP